MVTTSNSLSHPLIPRWAEIPTPITRERRCEAQRGLGLPCSRSLGQDGSGWDAPLERSGYKAFAKRDKRPWGNRRAWIPPSRPAGCPLPTKQAEAALAGATHKGGALSLWGGAPPPAQGAQPGLAAHAGRGEALGSKVPGLVPPKD